jgi:hypothetical protein
MRVRAAYAVLALGAALGVVMVLLIVTAPDTHPRAPAPVPTDGCVSIPADELYVQRAYACSDGTRVLTFSDVTARDACLKVATTFGVMVIDEESTWVRIRTL